MAEPDLVQYIRERIQKGVLVEEIRSALKKAGWKDADIEASLLKAGASSTVAPIGDTRAEFKKIKSAIEDLNARVLELEGVTGERRPIFETTLEASSSQIQPMGESVRTTPVSADVEKTESVETKITGKWFAGVGIIALLFGVGFFLKYAFENNLIGVTGRVMMGIIAGIALLVVGDILSRKETYRQYSFFLSGGGLAILYLSIYGAFNFYQLIDQTTAFIFMAIITAGGAVLSLKSDSARLANMSLLGGFLTPFLVSNGTDSQVALFTYILLLDLSFLGISYFKKWLGTYLLSFFGTYFVYYMWSVRFYSPDKLWPTMFFLTAFFAVFLVAAFLSSVSKKKISTENDVIVNSLNALAYFSTSYFLLKPLYEPYLGFFFVLGAAAYLLAAYMIAETNKEDKYAILALGGVGLVLVTVAVPIQLHGMWITIAWAIEGLVLAWTGFALKSHNIRMFANIVFAVTVLRLIGFEAYLKEPISEYVLIFNNRFWTFVLSIAALFAGANLYHRHRDELLDGEKAMPAVLGVAANLLSVYILSAESSAYFNQRIAALETPSAPSVYSYNYNENSYNSPEYQSLVNMENLSLSVLWGVYSAVLMVVGILKHSRASRILSIIGFGIVILKVFFYDTSALSDLYRIISFIVLGIILLVVSFLFYRYKDKIKEFILSQ